MHKFICKAQSGTPVPTEHNKRRLFEKIMKDAEERNITFTITYDLPSKDINDEQEKLYKAFILKAANHFGTDFTDMQRTLKVFFPEDFYGDPIHISRWSSQQLDDFITRATAHLAEFGFHF